LSSLWFWLFAVMQFIFFAMISLPDGRFKLSGMALVAVSILMLWSSQDRGAAFGKRLAGAGWKSWVRLALVVITFPLLYILVNGYLHYVLLMLVDLAGQQIMPLFSPASAVLPFGIITLAKFLSLCFNLLPITLLLSTYLAVREIPAANGLMRRERTALQAGATSQAS
jgi:hypothetical protein